MAVWWSSAILGASDHRFARVQEAEKLMPPPSLDLKEVWLGSTYVHVAQVRSAPKSSARRLPLRSQLPWPQSSLGATRAPQGYSTDDVAELTHSDALSEVRLACRGQAGQELKLDVSWQSTEEG